MRYSYLQAFTNSGRMVFEAGGADTAHVVAEDNGDTIHYVYVFDGEIPAAPNAEAAAERAFVIHNRDDRPRGKEIRSMSVGDVVVVYAEEAGKLPTVLVCRSSGFQEVTKQSAFRGLVDAARRKAYTSELTREVYDA